MSRDNNDTPGWEQENDECNETDATANDGFQKAKEFSGASSRLALADLSISNVQKKKKIPSFDSPSEMVTDIVGTDPSETFTLHREHACHFSRPLASAFNGEFVEGQLHTIKLEEQHPGAFRHLMQWFYRQKLNNLVTAAQVSSARTPEEKASIVIQFETQTTDLFNLWLLADYLEIPRVQNAVIDVLLLTGPLPFSHLASLSLDIYARTAPDSQLRHFMAYTCAWNLEPAELDGVSEIIDKTFLIDLVKTFRNATPIHTVNSRKARMEAKHFYVKK